MANVASHIQHVKPLAQTIMIGYSMLTLVASNVATAIVSAGLAWYIRGRGLTGVQIDLNNIKNDITTLKAKLNA